MNTRAVPTIGMALLVTVLSLPGCGHRVGTSGLGVVAPGNGGFGALTTGGSSPVAPAVNPADFVGQIDNLYFPLVPGTVYSYREATDHGVETVEVVVSHDTKTILGVVTTVVRDRGFVDGALAEDTFDWYAQDKEGNVWYFGEETKEYRGGVVVSTAGSWEAGKDGGVAGIIMEAHPRIGDKYRQEFAAGVAEDMASVRSLDKEVSVPYGTFDDCLETLEFTPLSPGDHTFKYYAPGVGLVLEDTPRGGHRRVELIAVTKP